MERAPRELPLPPREDRRLPLPGPAPPGARTAPGDHLPRTRRCRVATEPWWPNQPTFVSDPTSPPGVASACEISGGRFANIIEPRRRRNRGRRSVDGVHWCLHRLAHSVPIGLGTSASTNDCSAEPDLCHPASGTSNNKSVIVVWCGVGSHLRFRCRSRTHRGSS